MTNNTTANNPPDERLSRNMGIEIPIAQIIFNKEDIPSIYMPNVTGDIVSIKPSHTHRVTGNVVNFKSCHTLTGGVINTNPSQLDNVNLVSFTNMSNVTSDVPIVKPSHIPCVTRDIVNI